MDSYDGKNVVITGGSSGFGLETVRLLIRRGAQVLITGRNQGRLDAARKQLGNETIAVKSDAASLSDIDALAERVRDELGGLDGLFVNAGVTRFVPFESMTETVYDELFTVNTKGPYFTVQKLAPPLQAGSGVVLTTSVSAVLGIPMISAYAASKAALRSMTRSLARELLPREVRVNAVSPGPIDTGILERTLPDEAAKQATVQMTADTPMRRFGDSREVTVAVAFLLFDATYTTGSELAVDGGGSQL